MRVRSLLAAILFLAGGYLLLPPRNVAGNPWFEKQISRCALEDDGLVLRLHEGSGGATTANWYSVTVDSLFSRERQVVYAYGVPIVRSLECDGDRVRLGLWDGVDESSLVLTASRLEDELRTKPLTLLFGEPFEPVFNWLNATRRLSGAALLLGGLLAVLLALNRFRYTA